MNLTLFICKFQQHFWYQSVTLLFINITMMGKKENVEINNSPQVGFEQRPVELKFSTLQNELKRYPSSTALVVILVNPRLDIQRYSDILYLS